MSHILSVTLNAAIDVTLAVPQRLTLGEYNKVSQMIRQPGGKGMNVARVLNTLKVPVYVSGCTGGEALPFMQNEWAKSGVKSSFVEVTGGFRTCTAVVELDIHRASEINEAGPTIAETEAQAFLDLYARLLPETMLVSLSGSLPPGLPPDYYARLIELAHVADIPIVLDTSGPALRLGVAARPLLVKPNATEARDFIGREIRAIDDAIAVGREMCQLGTPITVITRGAEGAVLVTEQEAWVARLTISDPISTVGCGDAFVAGFITSLYRAVERGESPTIRDAASSPALVRRSFVLAMACGAANTLRLGAGILTVEDVTRLEAQVELSNHISFTW